MTWTREQMAARCAADIADGSYVNLGIGLPELVARYVPEGREFIYHTENGLLGMGPPPAPGEAAIGPVAWFSSTSTGIPSTESNAATRGFVRR